MEKCSVCQVVCEVMQVMMLVLCGYFGGYCMQWCDVDISGQQQWCVGVGDEGEGIDGR